MNFEKLFLAFGNYLYPFLAFPILVWLWHRATGVHFTALVMGLPVVFGYLIPGIGTNVLKKWRFRGRWLIGNFFAHQGFIYASTMGLALYLSLFPADGAGALPLWLNMVRTAVILCFIGWYHDLLAVRHGWIEIYNGPWKRGAGPEAIVAHAAPLPYLVLGASYAGIATWGYQLLVQQQNPASLWWLFPLGLLIISVTTSLAYLWIDRQ